MKTKLRCVAICIIALFTAVVFLPACNSSDTKTTSQTSTTTAYTPPPGLLLTSTAFQYNGTIPAKHTCSGQNVSPALSWARVPAGTKSFAIIMDDKDARLFTHWVIFNIPADTTSLPEAMSQLPPGAIEGMNGFDKIGYGGPCPPPGTPHNYRFMLYALDNTLNLQSGAEKAALLEKMTGHIIERAELVGVFKR